MKRYGDAEGLAIRPCAARGEGEQPLGDGKGGAAVARALLLGIPVGEHRVADELIDLAVARVDEVPRLAEPRAERLRELVAGHLFRHGAEASDVAHEQRDGPRLDGRGTHRADHRHLVLVGRRRVVGDLHEHDDVVRDADAHPVFERHRHDDALVIHEGAVATAEVDELVLPAVVAADDGVLS